MSILDTYGIQEVCDVTFYKINEDGNPTVPALYLDTLKISTLEQTAENTQATGGKGNAPLIQWDFGKEITFNVEDALFSMKSLAVIYGDGNVYGENIAEKYIMRTMTYLVPEKYNIFMDLKDAITAGTEEILVDLGNGKTLPLTFTNDTTKAFNAKFYKEDGSVIEDSDIIGEKRVFISYDVLAISESLGLTEIKANTFPGTYYVVGDTLARGSENGEDELFQIVIPKAKILVDNTLTLEAGGDPSVFGFNMRVLKPGRGQPMVRLVKYDVSGDDVAKNVTLVHNHILDPQTGSSTTKSINLSVNLLTGSYGGSQECSVNYNGLSKSYTITWDGTDGSITPTTPIQEDVNTDIELSFTNDWGTVFVELNGTSTTYDLLDGNTITIPYDSLSATNNIEVLVGVG